MDKNEDVTLEQAQDLINRVASELGLKVSPTKAFHKVEGPTNKHCVYVQKSRKLNRIDTTIPLPDTDPAYVQLGAPNGAIRCHVRPSLEDLERVLRMLGDSSLAAKDTSKPRPFAPTKAPKASRPPAPRSPIPTMGEIPAAALEPIAPPTQEQLNKEELARRLQLIADRVRLAKVRRLLECPEEFGEMTEEEAEAAVDGHVSLAELREAHRARLAAPMASAALLQEIGVDAVVA